MVVVNVSRFAGSMLLGKQVKDVKSDQYPTGWRRRTGNGTGQQSAGAGGHEAGPGSKVAEIHGMSQRGGSVVTQVRHGESLFSHHSPGEADAILAFEKWRLMLAPTCAPGPRDC